MMSKIIPVEEGDIVTFAVAEEDFNYLQETGLMTNRLDYHKEYEVFYVLGDGETCQLIDGDGELRFVYSGLLATLVRKS